MAPLDEFQSRLALADPAFAGDQHTDAIHLNEHSMDGLSRGENLVEGLVESSRKVGGDEVCLQDGRPGLLGKLYEFRTGFAIVAEYKARDVVAEKFLYAGKIEFTLKFFQVNLFSPSEDLN